MVGAYENRWQLLALRAAAAVMFGLTLLVWPGISIDTVALAFAAYALGDATLSFVAAMMASTRIADRVSMTAYGMAGLVASLGVVTVFDFLEPDVKLAIAAWAVTVGVCEALAAYFLRERVGASWAILLPGAAAVLLGAGLALSPRGALTPPWAPAVFVLLYGGALGTVAWGLQRGAGRVTPEAVAPGVLDLAPERRALDAAPWWGDPLGISRPDLEVFERDGRFHLRAKLPGFRRQDVSVELTDERVTIRGERRQQRSWARGGTRHVEWRYGTFMRTLPLPVGADASTAEASFRDGMLDVRMKAPLASAPPVRHVEITDGPERKSYGAAA